MISTRGNSITSAHYSRMGEEECRKIHLGTLEILERTGVDVHDEKAREILVNGGAFIEGQRIRIPEHMVTKALSTVPQRLTLYDRFKKPRIRACAFQSYFGESSDCLTVLDHQTGKRGDPQLADVINAVKIMDSLPEIDFIMSLFLLKDVDQRIYDRYQMAACLITTVSQSYL